MSDRPVPTFEQQKSRRGLLALVGAGGAAVLAALVGRSARTEAGHDTTNVFHLGEDNTAVPTAPTTRTAGIDNDAALTVDNADATTAFRDGIYGFGSGVDSAGFFGLADTWGVLAVSATGDGIGVEGDNTNAGELPVGVLGLAVVPITSAQAEDARQKLKSQARTDALSRARKAALAAAAAAGTAQVTPQVVGPNGIGVIGSGDVIGVVGTAVGGVGTVGSITTGDGIWGLRESTTGAGGGVQGFSGVPASAAPARIGVRGRGKDEGVRGEASGSSNKAAVRGVAFSGAVSVRADGGPMLLPRLTTAERKAIASPINGMIIYNKTVNKVQVKTPAGWINL
ncbi:MAG: hypothetical protein HYS09_07490 [Chloroflexi bacterium]|nr:hypothetical protein [Chloroflexota bacterium]